MNDINIVYLQLVSQNEDLEKQLAEMKEKGTVEVKQTEGSSHHEDEIRRLQAQNAALQRSLNRKLSMKSWIF